MVVYCRMTRWHEGVVLSALTHYMILVVLLLMIRFDQQVVYNLMPRFPLLGFFNPVTRLCLMVI